MILGCNISDAHRPTIPFLPRGTPRSPVPPALPPAGLFGGPLSLQVPPQVVIPHVDPLHLHVGPEGVGDPEKALRLDFKALQPLNPEGPQRVEPPVLGNSVARRGMILAVGEDGWARGRVLPVRSDHPPVRHSADHAAAGEAGAGPAPAVRAGRHADGGASTGGVVSAGTGPDCGFPNLHRSGKHNPGQPKPGSEYP